MSKFSKSMEKFKKIADAEARGEFKTYTVKTVEKIYGSLSPLKSATMEIDYDTLEKYKGIAVEFMKLSGSMIDTMALCQSWLTHSKINLPVFQAIINRLNRNDEV
jgi:hypothetical protein